MKPGQTILSLLCCVQIAAASESHTVTFAVDRRLMMAVGAWNPQKGWIRAEKVKGWPKNGDVITLFQPHGKVAEVHVTEPFRTSRLENVWGWTADISPWDAPENFALAVNGAVADTERHAQDGGVDDAEARQIVRQYLHDRHYDIPVPFLTQVYRVDLGGDGQTELLICAHNDRKALRDDQGAILYALQLLVRGEGKSQKIQTLNKQISIKPPQRTMDEHERLYGVAPYFRYAAFPDLNADGSLEIVTFESLRQQSLVVLYEWKKGKAKSVLQADTGY